MIVNRNLKIVKRVIGGEWVRNVGRYVQDISDAVLMQCLYVCRTPRIAEVEKRKDFNGKWRRRRRRLTLEWRWHGSTDWGCQRVTSARQLECDRILVLQVVGIRTTDGRERRRTGHVMNVMAMRLLNDTMTKWRTLQHTHTYTQFTNYRDSVNYTLWGPVGSDNLKG